MANHGLRASAMVIYMLSTRDLCQHIFLLGKILNEERAKLYTNLEIVYREK
jgi:hypothetical protein